MNFKDILKTVGGGLLSAFVPGGGAIVAGLNAVLSDDNQLPENPTGIQVQDAVRSLPPEQQAEVLGKEYDVEIAKVNAWADIQGHLSKADATGASTRPAIAMMMAWLVVLQVFTVCALMMASVAMVNNEILSTIKEFWPMLLASMGIPAKLLHSYFGMRTEEKKHRVHAATGVAPLAGIISSIFNRK